MHADMFIRRARHIVRELFDQTDYEVSNGLCMLCVLLSELLTKNKLSISPNLTRAQGRVLLRHEFGEGPRHLLPGASHQDV